MFVSTRDHGPLTAASLSAIVRRLGKTAGLSRSLGAHSLRHRVGTKMARAHVPVRVAQAYLGHKSPNITFGYYQDIDEDDLREAGRLLSSGKPDGEEETKNAGEIIPFRRLG